MIIVSYNRNAVSHPVTVSHTPLHARPLVSACGLRHMFQYPVISLSVYVIVTRSHDLELHIDNRIQTSRLIDRWIIIIHRAAVR